MYNTYIFDFMGHYPVGAYLAVVATNEDLARRYAKDTVKDMGFDPKSVTLMHVMECDRTGVFIIANGDY